MPRRDLYKYYCVTEGKFIEDSVISGGSSPIVCKNNPAHTVDWANSLALYYRAPRTTDLQLISNLGSNVVGISDNQTLNNKSLVDNTTNICDNLDNTKKLVFQCSGISTGTTRTMTIPDANTELVGHDATQTLTNKIIDADLNTITNIANSQIKESAGIDAAKIGDGSVDNTEFQYLTGATSNIQSQINDHAGAVNNPHSVTKDQIGLGNVDNIKSNLSALLAPTVDNDIDDGYQVGSRWVDTAANKEYVCLDSTAGSAVWRNTSFPDTFDAIVDINGSADYTSIAAAFSAGAKSVYVRAGVYYETSNIVLPDGGRLVGEVQGHCTIALIAGNSIISDGSSGIVENTGTISITNFSKSVVGVGTTFTNLNPGQFLLIGNTFFTIAAVNSDTSITLLDYYFGTDVVNASYIGQSLHSGNTISNFIIAASSSYGVFIRAVRHGVFTELATKLCGTGIHIEASAACTLTSSAMQESAGYGLVLKDCTSITCMGCNTFNSVNDGIQMVGNNHAVILNTCMSANNNGVGLNIMDNATKTVVSNMIINKNSSHGIVTASTTDTTVVSSCIIEGNGGDGVDFNGTTNTISYCVIDLNGGNGIRVNDGGVVSSNHIFRNGGDAIYLDNDDDCQITANYVYDNTEGGISGLGHLNNIEGNTLKNNSYGVRLTGGNDNCIIGNTIQSSVNDGIEIGTACLRTTISDNKCLNNGGNGIETKGGSHDCNISGNSCYMNTLDGIVINGNNCIVDGNRCLENGGVGLNITTGSTNTTVQTNDFTGNTGDNITDSGQYTSDLPPININELDAKSGSVLKIGRNDATKIELSNTGIITEIKGNLDILEGLDVTGNITVTGIIDGRDVAMDGSNLDSHIGATGGVHGITGDIVGTTDIQTLTNKSVIDDTFSILDNLDNSKILQFDVSNISASNTRILSVPNTSTTIVGDDSVQTITNKTIDGDNNTIQNIADSSIKSGANIDAAKLADGSVSNTEFQYLNGLSSNIQGQIDGMTLSQVNTNESLLTTRGDTLYRGSGGLSRLPIGSNGQILSTDGNDPIWSNSASRINLTLDTQTISTSYSLTLNSPEKMKFVVSSSNNTLKLPNATTLPNGWSIHLFNDSTSTVPIAVDDDGDNRICCLQINENCIFTLLNNGTTNGEWTQMIYKMENIIHVSKNGGQFTSIKSAINSISNASSSNPYMIRVGPGTFIEEPMTLKPYVTIEGSGSGVSIITANSVTDTVITASSLSELNSLKINGASGSGGIGIRADSVQGFTIKNCNLGDCETDMYVAATMGATIVTMVSGSCSGTSSKCIHIDGRAITGTNNITFSYVGGSIVGSLSLSEAVRVEGPYANNVTLLGILCQGYTVGKNFVISDGAAVKSFGCNINLFNTGVEIENVGTASSIFFNNTAISNCTNDILISHPSASGIITGIAEKSKVSSSSNMLSMSFTDPTDPGLSIVGKLNMGYKVSDLIDISQIVFNGTLGIISGGSLSEGSPLYLDIGAGTGYLETGGDDHALKYVEWSGTSISLNSSTTCFVYVDSTGTINTSQSKPSYLETILLGRVRTDASGIEFIDQSRLDNHHYGNTVNCVLSDILKGQVVSGLLVTANSSRELEISSGRYYFADTQFNPSGASSPASFVQYNHSSGSWVTSNQTIVNNTQYDNGTDLTSLTLSYFVKHSLYLVGDGDNEKYMLVVGQEQHMTLVGAQNGDLPTPPTYFEEGVILIASIIVERGNSTFADIIDERPRLGGAASSTASVSDHGSLTGLLDDDHTQYLLASGGRNMSGTLNMGNNSIINSGTINGITLSSHASRHLPNGSDPLTTAAPTSSITMVSTNTEGTANSFARSDHTHHLDPSGFMHNTIGGLTVGDPHTQYAILAGRSGGQDIIGGTASSNNLTFESTSNSTKGSIILKDNTEIQGNLILNDLDTRSATTLLLGKSTATKIEIADTGIITEIQGNLDVLEGLDVIGNITVTGTVDGRDIATDGSNLDSHIAATSAHGISGNIVGTSDTQILTNKTFTNNSTYFQDDSDTTKKLQFDLSSLSTSTTRTLSIPDNDIVLVGIDNSQTLTNKTINADNNTFQNISNGNIKSGAAIDATKIANGSISNAEFQRLNGITSTVVGISDTQTLSNKILTLPQINDTSGDHQYVFSVNELSADRNITLPLLTNNDTFVFENHSQTITNKLLDDNTVNFISSSDTTKQLAIELNNSTSSTTTTLNFQQTINRTLTFPDATTTLIGTGTTDILTNKTINATNNTISNLDNTNIKSGAQIDATKIANGTIDNTEFQYLNGVTSSVVGISNTQTLTNKIITDNSNTVAANSLKTTGSSVTISTAAPPSTGQVLKATSSTSASWQNESGGGSITYQVISATASTATTSSSFITVNKMTVTPASGTYMVSFSATGENTSVQSTGEYAIYKGNTIISHTCRVLHSSSGWNITNNLCIAMHTQDVIACNGSDTIEVRYKTSSGTFTIRERSLILLKIA